MLLGCKSYTMLSLCISLLIWPHLYGTSICGMSSRAEDVGCAQIISVSIKLLILPLTLV